eukprot:gene26967-34981_t
MLDNEYGGGLFGEGGILLKPYGITACLLRDGHALAHVLRSLLTAFSLPGLPATNPAVEAPRRAASTHRLPMVVLSVVQPARHATARHAQVVVMALLAIVGNWCTTSLVVVVMALLAIVGNWCTTSLVSLLTAFSLPGLPATNPAVEAPRRAASPHRLPMVVLSVVQPARHATARHAQILTLLAVVGNWCATSLVVPHGIL